MNNPEIIIQDRSANLTLEDYRKVVEHFSHPLNFGNSTYGLCKEKEGDRIAVKDVYGDTIDFIYLNL